MHQRKRQIQKITRDPYFSERDCWNLSTVLAKTIAAGLRRFSKMERHGYPASFLNIPEPGNRESGETETAIPVKRKP